MEKKLVKVSIHVLYVLLVSVSLSFCYLSLPYHRPCAFIFNSSATATFYSNMNYQNGKRTTAVLWSPFSFYTAQNCEFVILKLKYLVIPSYLPSLLGFLSALPKNGVFNFTVEKKQQSCQLVRCLCLAIPPYPLSRKKATKKAENKVWSVLPYPIPTNLLPNRTPYQQQATTTTTQPLLAVTCLLPATQHNRFPSLSSAQYAASPHFIWTK